jgi:hypothetical protein
MDAKQLIKYSFFIYVNKHIYAVYIYIHKVIINAIRVVEVY